MTGPQEAARVLAGLAIIDSIGAGWLGIHELRHNHREDRAARSLPFLQRVYVRMRLRRAVTVLLSCVLLAVIAAMVWLEAGDRDVHTERLVISSVALVILTIAHLIFGIWNRRNRQLLEEHDDDVEV